MHSMIMDFTGYKNLAKVTKTGWVQVDRARQLLLPIEGRQKEAFQEHQAVIQALEKRDVKLARKKIFSLLFSGHLVFVEKYRPRTYSILKASTI